MHLNAMHDQGGARLTARTCVLVVLACASALLTGASKAEAGTYKVNECNYVTGHLGYPDAAFYATNNGYSGPVACHTWIGLSIQNPIPISVGSYASWSFTSPPGTVWTNVHFWYSLEVVPFPVEV